MVFSSFEFLFRFLPVFLVIYFICPAKWRNHVLFAGSIVFYVYGEAEHVVLLLMSVLVNYVIGRLMYPDAQEGRGKRQAFLLCLALFYDFGMLFFFKYSGFAGSLPLGISFYTFQISAYVIDVYRGRVPAEKSVINLGTYLTMFPQLIAGPIVRFRSIQKELGQRSITFEKISDGAGRFVCGLCKKVLVADNLGMLVSYLEKADEGHWILAIAYMLQLYYDFSGYSDMAIGLGKMLGFTFPENFDHPFISKSITEFWRRWHMTLGGWFRDYVYIPLGGSRCGMLRWCFNMFVVWFLSGLWHGAGWNFVLWGVYFGILLSLEKLIGNTELFKKESFKTAGKICGHLYVLFAVLISFIIFRVENLNDIGPQILALFRGHGDISAAVAYEIKSYAVLILLSCIGATPVLQDTWNRLKRAAFWEKSGWLLQTVLIVAGLLLSTAYLLGSSAHPFLYFRF